MNWTAPFEIINSERAGPIVIVCDHASNAVPPEIGDLGVAKADMLRHIAWDIGAGPIARWLAEAFDAPAILCGTSRLVIDCNRQLHDPTLIPAKTDGTVIPANLDLSSDQRAHRTAAYFDTYHSACHDMIEARYAAGRRPLFVSVHSMTDGMNGKYRPWEISLSSNDNRRATEPALEALRKAGGVTIGDNQPYNMDAAEDYSTPVHALSRGLDYLQVEFRQDVVTSEEGQKRYAEIFGNAIIAAIRACRPT